MRKVLVIAGPTAAGKTSFGIRLAELFDGEIISGDSIQVYRGLDIGSAKATKQERDQIPHHLIDIRDPKQSYTVRDFQEEARRAIEDISNRGKLPIIVGGTELYIKACLYDYVFPDEEGEDELYEDLSNEDLYERIREKDPKALEKIHPNNRKRLLRAYNILVKHGKGISEIKDAQEHKCLYDAMIIGLTLDRKELYQRVEERVRRMIEDGLLEEIRGLLDSGVSFDDRSMSGIGYKEFRPYFESGSPLEPCVEEVIRNTKHFVKRQYTWFNHQLPVNWFSDPEEAETLITGWMNRENMV